MFTSATTSTTATYVATFSSLQCLHSLHLLKCRHPELLLPHSIHAPALLQVSVRSQLNSVGYREGGSTEAASHELAQLRALKPQLHTKILEP